jgi:hypothetical protein
VKQQTMNGMHDDGHTSQSGCHGAKEAGFRRMRVHNIEVMEPEESIKLCQCSQVRKWTQLARDIDDFDAHTFRPHLINPCTGPTHRDYFMTRFLKYLNLVP